MNYEIEKINIYNIIRLKDDIFFDTNISELKQIIEKELDTESNFALSLTEKSNLSSMSIGVILECYGMIHEKGGKMAFIHPNDEDLDLLETLSFTCIIETYTSEEDFIKANKK